MSTHLSQKINDFKANKLPVRTRAGNTPCKERSLSCRGHCTNHGSSINASHLCAHGVECEGTVLNQEHLVQLEGLIYPIASIPREAPSYF